MNIEAPNRIKPGGGTSFQQAEPAMALNNVEPVAAKDVADSPATAETYQVLLVDDTPAIHDDFRKILSQEEPNALDQADCELFGTPTTQKVQKAFTVQSAYQGQEALGLVERALKDGQRYSLVFLDIRMPPGWDGIETLSHLWKADPDLQVVICTAYSDYSWGQICERFGSTDSLVVLKKPFDNIEVLQLAHTLTKKWQLNREAKQRLELLDAIVAQKTEQLRTSNAELLREIAERKAAEARTQAFSTLGQKLSATKTAQNAAQIIAEMAGELIGWDSCAVELYCPEADSLQRLLAVDRVDGESSRFSSGARAQRPSPFTRLAIEQGGQLFTEEEIAAFTNKELSSDAECQAASMLVVPIRNQQSVIGVLSIQSYRANAFTESQLKTLQGLAEHCGGALDRIKTEEELHRTQEQLRQSQKLEAIGQLAGGVAHDFNNLLTVMRGNTELVLMNPAQLTSTAKECLNQVKGAIDRAAGLTRQLLAFSRKQLMELQPLDLNDVVGNLANMLRRLIGEDVQLRPSYATKLPMVHADSGMLEQAIINLAVNARDAMPKGGELSISTEVVHLDEAGAEAHEEARPGAFVVLTVRDSGTGISPEHLPHIFEPFFTTKGVGKGTGLGLATVYGIIKQHQGWIDVESAIGRGSTFKAFLPVLETERHPPRKKAAVSAPRGGDESILLVEDEDSVRTLTRRLLESYGYFVREANSGRSALDLCDREGLDFELLLTDVIMPEGVDGRELAEQLRLKKPGLKIVFTSGYSGDVLQGKEFLQSDNARFIAKPSHPHELLRIVREALDEKICEAEAGGLEVATQPA